MQRSLRAALWCPYFNSIYFFRIIGDEKKYYRLVYGQRDNNFDSLVNGPFPSQKYTSFYLTAFKSCTLIYVENNTWMGIYSGGDPPSDNSQTSATINYLEYTYPSLPTFPDIVY